MTIRQRVTVLPGGTIEVHDPQLPDGAEAEVLITVDAGEGEASPRGAFVPEPGARPFWEDIIALGASIPREEWEKVPRDLSINLDHYLYGAPKEEE
jgi:hypothetical protein